MNIFIILNDLGENEEVNIVFSPFSDNFTQKCIHYLQFNNQAETQKVKQT